MKKRQLGLWVGILCCLTVNSLKARPPITEKLLQQEYGVTSTNNPLATKYLLEVFSHPSFNVFDTLRQTKLLFEGWDVRLVNFMKDVEAGPDSFVFPSLPSSVDEKKKVLASLTSENFRLYDSSLTQLQNEDEDYKEIVNFFEKQRDLVYPQETTEEDAELRTSLEVLSIAEKPLETENSVAHRLMGVDGFADHFLDVMQAFQRDALSQLLHTTFQEWKSSEDASHSPMSVQKLEPLLKDSHLIPFIQASAREIGQEVDLPQFLKSFWDVAVAVEYHAKRRPVFENPLLTQQNFSDVQAERKRQIQYFSEIIDHIQESETQSHPTGLSLSYARFIKELAEISANVREKDTHYISNLKYELSSFLIGRHLQTMGSFFSSSQEGWITHRRINSRFSLRFIQGCVWRALSQENQPNPASILSFSPFKTTSQLKEKLQALIPHFDSLERDVKKLYGTEYYFFHEIPNVQALKLTSEDHYTAEKYFGAPLFNAVSKTTAESAMDWFIPNFYKVLWEIQEEAKTGASDRDRTGDL